MVSSLITAIEAAQVIYESLPNPGESTQKEWMEMQSRQGMYSGQRHIDALLIVSVPDPQMQMMNQAATNSINMSNTTTNNIQQMSLARNGEMIAAWGALHYRQNLRHMGKIMIMRIMTFN